MNCPRDYSVRSNRWTRLCLGVVALTVAASSSTLVHGQEARCLDNSGTYDAPAGATYSDAGGMWLCSPGETSASRGGWVRLPPTATPPTTQATFAPLDPMLAPTSDAPTTDKGIASHRAAHVLAAALVAVAVAVGMVVVLHKRDGAALSGRLRPTDGRAALDLATFGRKGTIGTAGSIRVDGSDVAARHARLVASHDGVTHVSPLEGDVWIERRGLRDLARGARPLADGDVVTIGDRKFKYENLGAARPAPQRKARAAWLR